MKLHLSTNSKLRTNVANILENLRKMIEMFSICHKDVTSIDVMKMQMLLKRCCLGIIQFLETGKIYEDVANFVKMLENVAMMWHTFF